MTYEAVRIEEEAASNVRYRVVSGGHKTEGRTAGEALDALLAKEATGPIESSSILIQRFVPDVYFTLEQYDRMKELLRRVDSLTPDESTELDSLVDAELEATVTRKAAGQSASVR
jgi:hypothetical protein